MDSLNETKTYQPDGLISGDYPLQHKTFTLLSGQSLARGAVLGLIALGAATVTPDDVNTGDGVLTPAAEIKGALTQVGTYHLVCITEAANGGTFAVFAPDGSRLADAEVAVAYAGDHLNFTISDGANDFDIDDVIDVVIAAGSGKAKQSLTAAVDGSQNPVSILATAADASDADVEVPGYVSGQFDPNYLVLTDTGHTEATLKAAFEGKPIFLRAAI